MYMYIYIMNVQTHESPVEAVFVFTYSGHQRRRWRVIISIIIINII